MPRVNSSSEAPSHFRKHIGFFPSLAKIIINPDVLIHLLKELLQGLMSHPVLEGKPNANHVRARISYSRTQQLHNMDIITQCSK
jgi:hypothetical protein